MKCRQAEEWMDAALDAAMARDAGEPGPAVGTLPSGWRAQLDAHLEGCARCRRLWTQLGAAHAALRVPRPVPAPAGMLAEFHRRAAEAPRSAVVRPRPQLWIWPLASAAAGAAAAWIIATRVAPITTGPSFPQVSQRTVPAPIAAPHEGALSDSDAVTATPHSEMRAPTATRGRQPERPAVAQSEWKLRTEAKRLAQVPQFGYRDLYAKGKTDRLAATPAPLTSGYGITERLATGEKPAEENGLARGDMPAGFKRLTETANRPLSLEIHPDANFYYRGYVNAGLEGNSQDPPELRVSPAVLTALQRTVEPAASTTSVQQAASVLAQAADVAVEVDPRVAHRTVTLSESGVPLWKALEAVAEQSHAQVLPVRDHLVLKPISEVARMPRIAGAVRLNKAPTGPAASAAAAPAGSPAPAGVEKPPSAANRPAAPVQLPEVQAKTDTAPAEPRQVKRAPSPVAAKAGSAGAPDQRGARARGMDSTVRQEHAVTERFSLAAEDAPDRKVWGEAWGTLPERGFAVPSPAEIPPQTLGLDANWNAPPSLRQVTPGQQQPLSNVLRRNRQQNSR